MVTVNKPISVCVADTDGIAKAGLNVYVFDSTTYSGYSKVSDDYDVATFTSPLGDYRFRANSNGSRFWSGEENTCSVPCCTSANVILPGGESQIIEHEIGTSMMASTAAGCAGFRTPNDLVHRRSTTQPALFFYMLFEDSFIRQEKKKLL